MYRATAAACGMVVLLGAHEALAQEAGGGELPVPFVERPLTLPEKHLRADASFNVIHYSFGPGFTTNITALFLGAAFGITDDFEVSAVVIPLQFSEDFRYLNPDIGATYRFVEGDVEVGARLHLSIPVAGDRYFGILPSLPVLIRMGDIARLDTGVNFSFLFPTGNGDPIVAWAGYNFAPYSFEGGIPLKFTFQIVPQAFVGLRTGFGVANFDFAGESTFIPLGFHGGGTIENDGKPLVDITGNFDFPLFLTPGSDGDKVVSRFWTVGVTGSFYIGL
jgi:hypothetical protein